MNEGGEHPRDYRDFECEFAAWHVSAMRPNLILDIGSYRHFVLGLAASHTVKSLDVRERVSSLPTETVLTGDAKQLPLPDDSVDCIVSLCAIEHFGLGRYGDPFDLDADRKAALEMKRVLRPAGRLILSTTITRGAATIAFNAHRIYSLELVRSLGCGMTIIDEAFFNHDYGRCAFEYISADEGVWDIYCGCFEKSPRELAPNR